MKKAFEVFRRDLRRIFHSPVALVVVLGIAVVPCLYAWINILANWDPYENTGDVPVAVVNQDKAVTLESTGSVCAGDLMVDALKENTQIGWRFTDEDEALEGVRSGRYYAAIVIPNDFTGHLTGILSGSTEKAKLKYYVNEKVNPIAPKVTDAGASTIESQIDSKYIAKVGEVVTEKVGVALDKIAGDTDGALGRGSTTLGDVRTALSNVDSQLGDLQTSINSARDALNGAADKLDPLQGLGSRVSGQLSGARARLGETRSNADALLSDLNGRLGSASGSISSLSSRATYDVSALSGDIASAQAQVDGAIATLEAQVREGESVRDQLVRARDLLDAIDPVDPDSRSIKDRVRSELSGNIDTLDGIVNEQRSKIDELKALSEKIKASVQEVKGLSGTINDRVQAATSALSTTQNETVTSTLTKVNQVLDTFAERGQELETAATLVDPVISQASSLSRRLAEALSKTGGALDGTRKTVQDLNTDVSNIESELSAIRASSAWQAVKGVSGATPEGVSDFLSAPVDVNQVALFPVENYASGVAPFFTSLALWVGGIALVAIFKLEVDEEGVGRVRPWQAYFGRWLLFVLVGVLQAVICVTGDLVIGIQCAHPWALYLSAIVASFAFVNVIYALSVAFKHLGKALAFTLVILQVPGSAGTYPIEMMPPFFQAIGPWLPFTYSNNAMREAIAGLYGSNLAFNLVMLLVFVIPAILVGVTARGHLVNVNALFDHRLRETDHLAVSEPVAIEGNHYRLATVVKAYHSPREYRATFDERSAAFERAYPGLVRGGILALFLLPLFFFLLMLVLDAQLPTIALLVVALILIYSFLIVVEYFHDRVAHKRALTDMPREELREVLNDTLRDELMPFAPIDKVLERQEERRERQEERREGRRERVEQLQERQGQVIDAIRQRVLPHDDASTDAAAEKSEPPSPDATDASGATDPAQDSESERGGDA